MYDAINRGLRRAAGEVLAYLNCDEQYLPGALAAVVAFFGDHPRVDVLFGDVVIVDDSGAYLCHRKAQPPLKYHTWVCHLSTLSGATFFRRRLIEEGKFLFDPAYRSGGDGEWMVRLLTEQVPMASLRQFTTTFTDTGANLGRGAIATEEWRRLRNTAPAWARALAPLWVAQHRLRRWLDGSYSQPPFSYSLYTRQSPQRRVSCQVTRPRFRLTGKSQVSSR
jgi:glycosyltransferase involved in cell wall biosynthesis